MNYVLMCLLFVAVAVLWVRVEYQGKIIGKMVEAFFNFAMEKIDEEEDEDYD